MTDDWYFLLDGTIHGPIPFEELAARCQSRQISRDLQLRQGTSGDWCPAEAIVGLFPDPELSELREMDDLSEIRIERETSIATSASGISWFALVLGSEMGPMPWSQLKQLAAHGEIDTQDRVRPENGVWRPAGYWAELRTAIAQAPPTFESEPPDQHAEVPWGQADSREQPATRSSSSAASESTDGEWYCNVMGVTLGPMTLNDVRAMVEQQQLGSSDLVRYRADGTWRRPGELPELSALNSSRTSVRHTPDVVDAPGQWFCRLLGNEFGPLPLEKLRDMAALGELSPSDAVRYGADGEWAPAESFSELLEMFDTSTGSLEGDDAADVSPPFFEQPAPSEPTAAVSPPHAVFGDSPTPSNESAPTTESRQPATEPEVEWFMRASGVEHGPLEYSELKHLAEKQRLLPHDEIRCGEAGTWLPAGSVAELFRGADPHMPPKPLVSDFPPASPSPPKSKPARQPFQFPSLPKLRLPDWSSARGHFNQRTQLIVIAACGVCLLVAAVWWLSSGSRDQEYYEVLTALLNEHRDLRARAASPSEWSDFAKRAETISEPIVAELKQTANADHPIKQHLLWAASEHLLPMIQNARETAEKNEAMYDRHLEEIQRLMTGQEPLPLYDATGEIDFAGRDLPVPNPSDTQSKAGEG